MPTISLTDRYTVRWIETDPPNSGKNESALINVDWADAEVMISQLLSTGQDRITIERYYV